MDLSVLLGLAADFVTFSHSVCGVAVCQKEGFDTHSTRRQPSKKAVVFAAKLLDFADMKLEKCQMNTSAN